MRVPLKGTWHIPVLAFAGLSPSGNFRNTENRNLRSALTHEIRKQCQIASQVNNAISTFSISGCTMQFSRPVEFRSACSDCHDRKFAYHLVFSILLNLFFVSHKLQRYTEKMIKLASSLYNNFIGPFRLAINRVEWTINILHLSSFKYRQ